MWKKIKNNIKWVASIVGSVIAFFAFMFFRIKIGQRKEEALKDEIKKTEGKNELVDKLIGENENDLKDLKKQEDKLLDDLNRQKEEKNEDLDDFFDKRNFDV